MIVGCTQNMQAQNVQHIRVIKYCYRTDNKSKWSEWQSAPCEAQIRNDEGKRTISLYYITQKFACLCIYVDNMESDGLSVHERKKRVKNGTAIYLGNGRLGYYTLSGHYNFKKFPGGDGCISYDSTPKGQWTVLNAKLKLTERKDASILQVDTSLGSFAIACPKYDYCGYY